MRIISAFFIIIGLSGCSTVSGWFEEDTYEAAPTELTEFKLEFTPKVIWSVDTGDGSANEYSNLSNWIQDDAIIAVDHNGEVSSYDLETGKKQWKVDINASVMTGVGGGEGLILIGTKDGQIFALDGQTGKTLWTKALSSEVLAPPKAGLGIAVVRTSDGRMTGLSTADGSVLWNYQRAVPLLSLRGVSAPVISGDTVVAGYANGKLVALSLTDGAVIWEKSIAVPRGRTELDRIVDIDSDPVIYDDVIYVVTYQGNVAAVSLSSGRIYWSRDASSRAGLDAVSGDAVFVTDDMGNIWSYQDGSGDALWRQTRLLHRKVTGPTVAGNNIVIGDLEGYVHFLSINDGHFTSRIRVTDKAIRSKAIYKNNTIYINATDGTLTALRVN